MRPGCWSGKPNGQQPAADNAAEAARGLGRPIARPKDPWGRFYKQIDHLRLQIPDDSGLDMIEPFLGMLATLSAFDLGQDRLPSFASFRFLYERLLGASVRPWLPAAFCAASALPHLHPEKRRILLQSISESAATAPGWSNREPVFWPEWVEKVDVAAAA